MHEVDGVRFMLLSLEQYLAVYKQSSKDGYRVNVRQKKDADKIKFIEANCDEKSYSHRLSRKWKKHGFADVT